MDLEVENESLVCTETECPGPVIETINTQDEEQQMKLKEVKEVKEMLNKSDENPKTRGKKDQTIKEITKGRNKQLVLKKKKQADFEDPSHIFFRCMASTVMNFPPHLAVEVKRRVYNIIHEMELHSLSHQTYTQPMDLSMTSSESSSTQQNGPLIIDENLSNSDYTLDSTSDC